MAKELEEHAIRMKMQRLKLIRKLFLQVSLTWKQQIWLFTDRDPKIPITVTIVSIRIRTNGFGMHVEIETDVSQGVE